MLSALTELARTAWHDHEWTMHQRFETSVLLETLMRVGTALHFQVSRIADNAPHVTSVELMTGYTRCVQEEARREERAAAERMIAAQAEVARAKQRVAQLAAQTGASADLPPITDADAQVLLTGDVPVVPIGCISRSKPANLPSQSYRATGRAGFQSTQSLLLQRTVCCCQVTEELLTRIADLEGQVRCLAVCTDP